MELFYDLILITEKNGGILDFMVNKKLELDMEQEISFKQEKEHIKAVYCHPDYLTYMQSIS